MKQLTIFRIIIIFIMSSGSSHAAMRCLGVADGLSSSLVFALTFDQQGYLWVSTANGLNRYDGYSFVNFHHEANNPNSIGGGNLRTLLSDSRGYIWTAGVGLNRLKPQTYQFDHFHVSDGEFIEAILEDDDGDLWIGGNRTGLRQIDPSSGKILAVYKHDPGDGTSLLSNNINGIVKDGSGNLWIATNKGIDHFDLTTKTFTHFIPSRQLSGIQTDGIRNLLVNENGLVFAATSHGLVVYYPQTDRWKHYRHVRDDPHSLVTDDIWSLLEARNGDIWIGTDKNGMDKFLVATENFQHFPTDKFGHIPPGAVFDIHQEQDQVLWISVYNYGICRIDQSPGKFRHFRAAEGRSGLSFNNVLGLHEDRHGSIWIATDGGGLNRFDPQKETFTVYRHNPGDPNSLSSDSVISISEDDAGHLWLGTWSGGLNRFDPKTETFTHYTSRENEPDQLKGNSIFAIRNNSDQTLWLSVWDVGLQRFNPASGTFADYSSGNPQQPFNISNRHINFIEQTRDSDWWIGGHDGLERVRQKDGNVEFIRLNYQNDIYDMYESDDGLLWFATADGLVRYHPVTGEKRSFGIPQGFPDEFVTGIEVDNHGSLWLGTRRGLSRFNPSTYQVENYDVVDGLQSLEFNRFSHLKASSGLLYFGGPNGLNVFNPLHLPRNNRIPPVRITRFELFQKPVIAGRTPFLEKDIGYTEELTLPYSQHDIAFEFAALDFTAPQKNRYRYRLFGFDEDWTEVGSDRRLARYTNLLPGHYRFTVLGSNNDGVWNTEGAAVALTILEPWWMKVPFRIVTLVLLVVLLMLINYWVNRSAKARQRELERLVAKKSSELQRAMEQIEQANLSLENKIRLRTSALEKEMVVRREAEEQLLHLAMHDSLTGLVNRAWLMQKLETLLEQVHSSQTRFVVLFLDGDRFKMINDSLGHLVGDKLLVEVAQAILTHLPPGVHLSRPGGDEFVVLIEKADSIEPALAIANVILQQLSESFSIDGKKLTFGVSIGIVMVSDEYARPDEVLRDADIAMYRAKASGRNTYKIFDAEMRNEIQDEAILLSNLKHAIENKEFQLVYQPIVSLKDGRLHSFESLIRWQCRGRGMVGPDRFIPLAEDNGLILDIGFWTIQEVCRQSAAWAKQFPHYQDFRIGVNLSAKQLMQNNLIEQIDQLIAVSCSGAACIKFEITETALMENAEKACALLQQMKERGIPLAIDDFGTGHSSLSYLHRFPVQYLKIDRSFVAKIDSDKEALEITRAVIALARSLGIYSIAEGIESEEHIEILRACECDFGQGFLIDRPLDASEAENWLKSGVTERSYRLFSTPVS